MCSSDLCSPSTNGRYRCFRHDIRQRSTTNPIPCTLHLFLEIVVAILVYSCTNLTWMDTCAARYTYLSLSALRYHPTLGWPPRIFGHLLITASDSRYVERQHEDSFREAYQVANLNATSVDAMFSKLKHDPILYNQWLARRVSQYSPQRFANDCAIGNLSRTLFLECMAAVNCFILAANPL